MADKSQRGSISPKKDEQPSRSPSPPSDEPDGGPTVPHPTTSQPASEGVQNIVTLEPSPQVKYPLAQPSSQSSQSTDPADVQSVLEQPCESATKENSPVRGLAASGQISTSTQTMSCGPPLIERSQRPSRESDPNPKPDPDPEPSSDPPGAVGGALPGDDDALLTKEQVRRGKRILRWRYRKYPGTESVVSRLMSCCTAPPPPVHKGLLARMDSGQISYEQYSSQSDEPYFNVETSDLNITEDEGVMLERARKWLFELICAAHNLDPQNPLMPAKK